MDLYQTSLKNWGRSYFNWKNRNQKNIGNNLDFNSIRTINEINNLLISGNTTVCNCNAEVLTNMHKQWFSYKYSKYISYITKDKKFFINIDPQEVYYQIIDNIDYLYLIFFIITVLQILNDTDNTKDKATRFKLVFISLDDTDIKLLTEITEKIIAKKSLIFNQTYFEQDYLYNYLLVTIEDRIVTYHEFVKIRIERLCKLLSENIYAKNQIDDGKYINFLEERVKDLESKIDTKQNKIIKLNDEIKQFENEILNKDNGSSKLLDSYNDLKKNYYQLKNLHESIKEQNTKLDNELNAIIDNYQSELKKNESNRYLAKDLQAAKFENKRLKVLCDEIVVSNQELDYKLNFLKDENRLLSDKNTQLKYEFRDLQESCSDQKSNNEKINEDLSHEVIPTEKEELRTELNRIKEIELNEKINTLKDQNKNLQTKYNQLLAKFLYS